MPKSSAHVSGKLALHRVYELLGVLAQCTQKISRVDIVYAPVSTSALGILKDLYLGLLARVFRKPLVGHLHGGGESTFFEGSGTVLKTLIRLSRRQYSKIIVLGDLLRTEYDYLSPPAPLAVVPNGLPPESEPTGVIEKHLRSGARVELLYLSNMVPSKGYLLVLEACAILKQRGMSIHCRFCGSFLSTVMEDGRKHSLEDFLDFKRRLGLTDEIEYLGLVQGENKRQVLEEADIFLLPTSYPWEGQPISIIEALSWGVPVVSTNHKGIPEQVQHGEDGMLLEPDCTALDVADAVTALLRTPESFARFSREARHTYEERFTAKAFIDNLEKVIQSAMT